MAKAGEAYGFLKYGGKIEDILQYIPAIRNSALTPPELSLNILEGPESLDTKEDAGLAELVELSKGAGLNYVFRANLPNADNKRTASELGDVMNSLYNTLYKQGDDFCCEIAYKEGSEYVLRE